MHLLSSTGYILGVIYQLILLLSDYQLLLLENSWDVTIEATRENEVDYAYLSLVLRVLI